MQRTCNTTRVGLISDTHGTLNAKALEALRGVDMILHAGDIGGKDVLDALETIAPVEAVRGNMDYGPWSEQLPASTMVDIRKRFFYLIHDKDRLDLDPHAAGVTVVVCGHTHHPSIELVDNIWYINPGSASHPRYGQDPSIALVLVSDQGLDPKIISFCF